MRTLYKCISSNRVWQWINNVSHGYDSHWNLVTESDWNVRTVNHKIVWKCMRSYWKDVRKAVQDCDISWASSIRFIRFKGKVKSEKELVKKYFLLFLLVDDYLKYIFFINIIQICMVSYTHVKIHKFKNCGTQRDHKVCSFFFSHKNGVNLQAGFYPMVLFSFYFIF